MGRVYEVGVSIDWILRARWRAQMNDTPPGTNTEYSSPRRANQASATGVRRVSAEPLRAGRELGRGIRLAILGGAVLGSLLLIVAEFTALFTVHVATSRHPIKTVAACSHHS